MNGAIPSHRAPLCDGVGPLYRHGRPADLRRALEQIARWLPVES
ncbi:MAG TPA: hypothetical protein VFW09_22055 [Solirubrobacteraceae bacterium]|nr:hypothetical protein [Solirubrobacteraceae bacterium]